MSLRTACLRVTLQPQEQVVGGQAEGVRGQHRSPGKELGPWGHTDRSVRERQPDPLSAVSCQGRRPPI